MTSSRAVRISIAALATGAALSATAALPAEAAGLAIPVDCQVDNVVLDQSNATYQLYGTCGVVKLTGDNITVEDLPATRKLIVAGEGDTVSGKPVDRVVVHGRDNHVTVTTARKARVDSPGSTLRVTGLLEKALVPGNRSHVRADRLSKVVLDGNRNLVRSARGATVVHNHGDHNRIRVHKRA